MAILSDKDRKKLRNAVKKKKNTDTGRTAAEKQRKQSVSENAAASKKKNNSSAKKKTTTSSSSSVLNDTEKKEVEEIRRRTQSLRDRNTAVSQRDAYDSARRKAYGNRQSTKESKTKLPSLFDESKSKSGSLSLEDQKKNVQGIRRNAEEVKDRNYWLFNNGANKPVEWKANIPLQTQMTTEEISRRKSAEANQPLGFRNEGQAIAAAYAIDVPRKLIGAYDKAVNIPTADYYLNDKFRRYMNGGVKAPVYMGINPQKTAEAEAQAKREGYNSLEEWQIAKANEAMAKTDEYYAQKKELYDTADKYIESGRFDPWVRQAMEVAGEIGAMTPTMATAGAAGGLAKLIGLGGKAAWAFQNLLMGAEISGSVSGLEAKEMYNAVLNQKQNMIAFMGEDAYKAKTGNDGLTIDDYRDALKRANNTGELVGMAEAATEMLFGGIPLMGKGIVNKIGGKIGFELLSEPTKQQIRTFRNTIGGRVAKQVTERLGGTLGEGTEEAIMAVAQPYIETNVAGVESDVSIEDIIHDFGMGAAVSLILGMPVNAVNDTMIAYDAVQQRRQNKDFIKAAEERTNELVKEGQMTEEEAAASVREVRDILSGKGSLRVAEEAGYEEKTTSDTRRIYDSAEEAQKSLENEFKGKKIGDEVKGAYFDGDTVREFTAAKTEEGVKYRTADTTEGDIETYRAKAEKVKSAQNETERSGYQLNVKEDIIKEVSALSKALGRKIVFDEEAKTYNEDGSANVTRGWFDEKDGSIHVNIHNETPAATVVAHEITHSLEKTKAYKAMQKAVFDYYRSSLGAERKERGALYAEGGKTLESAKDVDYEVMANFVETKLLTDKETINYIVKRNKTFGERIVNGINRIVQRKIGSKEQKFLAGVRTKWEAALEESRKEGDQKEPSGDGKVKNAFGGEKAKTADLKKLGAAKYMLASGKSAEEIFRETGWFVGADGKWRFEIDDSGMVFHKQSKKGNPDQERQKELYNKMFAGDITQEEWKELSLLEKNGVRRQHQLEDYIDHTALFEAYPQLRKVDLVFSSEDTDAAGKYNSGKNRIVLNSRYKNAAEEVILHEIQHAIQQIEGFSGGTNREAWAVKDLGGDITKRYAKEYADLLNSISKEDSNKYLRYRDLEFAMDRLLESEKEEDMARATKYEEESDALYDEMYAEPWFLRLNKLYHLTNDGNALYRYLYTNSAGEIEARDVSSRRTLSAEERRQKMPDTGNEDTVFAEGDNRKYSLGKERDREYMAAVERGDMAEAQRMVDQAAKAAGYDSPKLYHGTPDRRKRDNTGEIIPNEDWNVFDPNKSNADRIDGSALFFANNKSVAEFYAPKKGNKNAKVFEVYLKQGKTLTVEGNGANWNRILIPSELPKRKYRGLKNMEYSDTADTTYICKEAKKAGYDSVHFKNIIDGTSNNKGMSGDVYAVFDSSQVKSADAVTYDDKGNVVPLSERFDAGEADIRYSVGKEKRKVSTEMGELIKAYNAEMMGVFYERSSADRRALWDMIHEEMVHVIETGAVRNEKIRDIIDFAYETGYRTENQDTEMKNTWGGGIYIHPLYRGEMNSLGGLQAVNRKMMGSGMYFTYEQYKKGSKTKYGGIDEAYSDLRAANPMMEDLIDPAEQVAAIVDLFGGGKRKQTLKDMDEEFFDTDFVEPYKDDIAKTVEKAFDDISTLARYEMTQKARKEGEAAGEKKGVEKGKKEASKEYAAEQKKKEKERRKQDEEALKMHDTILRDQQKQQAKEEKKRVDAQRKADESTMRMHDRLIKEVQDEADRKYAAEEKRKEKERQKMDEETLKEHDRLMKEEERKRKKEVKEELNKQAKEYKEAQKAERKSYEEIIKDQEKQKKKLEKEMDQQERQKKREEDSKRDKDRRGERIQLAQQEAKRRREKPQPGSTKSMYLNNKNVRKLCFEFRTDVISRLVEMGLFTDTNGEVVIDNNGMEVAWKTTYGKWEASNKKNEYTPYWGLTTLAEKEGIDADTFYTIYSKLVKMKEQGNTEGKNPKQRIVEYIESLDLTAKQKMFLYFDAAKYAYSNRPGTGKTKPFTDGGTVTEPKGNIRGIMIRMLDDITFDMYRNANMAPTLLQSEESRQIRQKDITDFLDAVFGEETSEQKDQFSAYFMGIIEDFSSQIESARMIAMSNLLIDKPQEKNSLRMNIVRSYRQTKRQFVAEGEAFERMSSKLKDPLYAAYYYGAKKYTAVANEMIYGKGQRGLDGKKQGKSLYQIFEPIFKADEKNKNNEKMKLLTLFVNCRHDQYRLMNGKGYTGYTVEECKDIVERISEKHPEIVKAGDEIADYGRNLLRMCVESGRLSEEDYQYYTIKYPYYVPAFRYVERTYYDREGKVVRRDKDVIRKAKGGTQPDVLPLFDQMVNKTNEIVKVCKKNQLAGRLANAHRLGATEYIADVRLTEAEERKKKKAEREQKKKEKQAKKNGGVVEKNLVAEEETPMEDLIDAIGEEEENLEDIIPWYSNGVKHEIEVADEGIIIGWDKLSPIKNEKDWLKVLRKFNDFRRGVLTQYNPTFWFTNGVKDLQDLFLYYPHAQRIVPFYAIAVKTMFASGVTGVKKGIDKRKGKQTDEERKNEAKLQEYLAYGMAESSIFQYDETEGGRRKKRTKVKGALRKPLDLFDGLNFSVEQLPRFAVYLETIDRLEKQRKEGGNEYTDEEIKTIAVYNASDATVNFGRSGTVVKNLNTYGCTFLNAGVQGTSKFVRMFTQVKDGNVKAIAFKAIGLGVKLSIFGLSPRILSDIFYGDDDDDKGWMQDLRKLFFGDDAEKVQKEYAEMADYQKLNYYLIYIKGEWIRIPRGRVAAFVRSFEFNGTKVAEGEMDALDLVIAQMDMASDTILFGNPITNNILGPCIEVWNNKDNWGREIVSEYEDKGEGFHYLEYDEDTSDLAIKLAEFGHYLTGTRFGKENSRLLDFSPKKLDHLIQQYLGSYNNLIVPFLSGDQTLSEKGMDALMSLAKKFYVDPTLSNRLAGDYYDLKEEYTNIANAHDGDSPYAVVDYVFKDYNEQLKAKREMIQTITSDPNMTRQQKLDRVSEIRAEMNELYRQGIADAKDLLGYADANYFGKEGNREVYEGWLDLTKDSDWKLSTMSDSAQAMYNEISSTGVTTENFVDAYNFFGNLTSDKDENGEPIRGSKKDKFVTYLNSLPATAEQKTEMYYSIGGYSRNKPAPAFANGAYKQAVLTDMSAPLPTGVGRKSSGFGYRTHPISGKWKMHWGVDIAAPAGTPVLSVSSGTVKEAKYNGGYGNQVVIQLEDGSQFSYSHLKSYGVKVGDVITKGQQIGEVGSTGTSSTGNHLHLEAIDANGTKVDPETVVDILGEGIKTSSGYTAVGGGGTSSGGSSGGGSKSGGGGGRSASGGSRTSGTSTASTGGRRSSGGSGSSGGSSGGVTLPTASQASAITGRSTKAASYSQGGVTLPTAKDLARSRGTTIAANKSGTGTPRTGTTAGTRFWDENVLG